MARYESPLLQRKEAWRYLELSETSFGRVVNRGEIPKIVMGGKTCFLKSDLDAYIKRCRKDGSK